MTTNCAPRFPDPTLLARAVAFAAAQHESQVDKTDQPYILHPVRVMLKARAAGMRVEAQAAAVLHDVVEDTPTTAEHIESLFGPEVRRLVELVSRRDGETYMDFVRRAGADPEGRLIKIFDIEDNMDPMRSGNLPNYEGMRRRYAKALLELGA